MNMWLAALCMNRNPTEIKASQSLELLHVENMKFGQNCHTEKKDKNIAMTLMSKNGQKMF